MHRKWEIEKIGRKPGIIKKKGGDRNGQKTRDRQKMGLTTEWDG